MKDKLTNLLSRKFILTALATVISIATLFTNTDDARVQIACLLVLLVAQVVYNVVEGNIDAKSVVSQAAATMTKINELLDQIDIVDDPEAVIETATDKALDAVKAATESGTED